MKTYSINMNFGDINFYNSSKQSEILGKKILAEKEKLDFALTFQNSLIGYKLKDNQNLTEIYNFPVKVVDFFLANILTNVRQEQFQLMKEMFAALYEHMQKNPAYYTLRLPANVADLLQAFNHFAFHPLFCGGTVMYAFHHQDPCRTPDSKAKAFIADPDYLAQKRSRLLEIIQKSFADYQSQYHISPVLRNRANQIYENWIVHSFDNKDEKIIVAEVGGEPVGLHSIGIRTNNIEGVLGAVDPSCRNKGAYKALISKALTFSRDQGKDFIIGTQLDNYLVQGQWAKFGLTPFFSFYAIHCDFFNSPGQV